MGIVASALSLPLWIFKKLGFTVKDVALGSIMLIMVAATMMVSSWLINLGTYDNFPSFAWVFNVSIGMMLF